jgi:DNA-binding CsgD family transcriptional regulator/tetratricopeptide (TPR) repeat protein
MDLLERSQFLEALGGFLHEAAAGHGRLVFVRGEAGIGKSALVQGFCKTAGARAKVAVASHDALSTPSPLDPLIRIGPTLGLPPGLFLDPGISRQQLHHEILAALRGSDLPTVLVGEDVHWADEATFNLIRFLGRRIEDLPVLIIITFRDDELGPNHPLRLVLGDLASIPSIRHISLPRLTRAAVRTMTAGYPVDADALHALTGGNPFFVTEILAGGATGMPTSVQDAVLARAARLSPKARRALDAAAILGSPIDPALLTAVIEEPAEQVTEEWLATGIVESHAEALAFRHELARQAILAVMSPVRSLVLHRRVVAVMERDPVLRRDVARLAHHAEAAGMGDAVLRYAPAAAERAAALRAHREAAAQYARALRFADQLPPAQRADLYERRAYECYLTGLLDEAIAATQAALALRRETGEVEKFGDVLRWLSRLHWFVGDSAAAEQTAREALAILEGLPPGTELARAYTNLAQLRMLSQEAEEAISWGERAIALAERIGDPEILAHALSNVGAAKLSVEDETGRPLLERSLALTKGHGYEDHVSRALGLLAWNEIKQRRHAAAREYLEQGIAYTTEHELDAMGHYLLAERALLRLQQGDWDNTLHDARAAGQHPAAIVHVRIVALTVLGYVQARRGDPDPTALDDALAIAEKTGQLMRIGPVRAARAEASLLAGDPARAALEARAVLGEAVRLRDRWLAGELALILHQTGVDVGSEVDLAGLADPFASQIRGDWQGAAEQWQALGCPLETGRALAAGDAAAVQQSWAIFDQLGARVDAAIAAQRLRELGVHRIPRGPRPATRANPALLTQRELEVLALIAEGRPNREIAARLFLSPRTVGHHVSSILAKLGARTRAEAARASAHLLQDRQPAPPI